MLDDSGHRRIADLASSLQAAEPTAIARLAPIVLREAQSGDAVAHAIAARAAEDLTHLVTAMRRAHPSCRQLARSGGLLQDFQWFGELVRQALRDVDPELEFHDGDVDPARGAFHLAAHYASELDA